MWALAEYLSHSPLAFTLKCCFSVQAVTVIAMLLTLKAWNSNVFGFFLYICSSLYLKLYSYIATYVFSEFTNYGIRSEGVHRFAVCKAWIHDTQSLGHLKVHHQDYQSDVCKQFAHWEFSFQCMQGPFWIRNTVQGEIYTSPKCHFPDHNYFLNTIFFIELNYLLHQ